MSQYLETAIIVFIVASIALIVWRGGAANPEGTGTLGRKLNALSGKVDTLDRDVRRIDTGHATKADVARIEAALKSQKTVTTDMTRTVEGIETAVADLGKDGAAREATLGHVKEQVDRLYNFIVNKGMQ